MKRERRHELQHNTLAEWLFKTGQWLKPYKNVILAGVVVLAVVVVVYTVVSRTSATRSAQAWTELTGGLQGDNLDALTRVAETHPNSTVGQMAAVIVADIRLKEGCDQRFVNKALANRELNEAVKSYQAALKNCRTPILLERATFGLARAKEAQGTSADLEAAAKYYGDVVTKWPDGTFAAAAKQRLADFGQHETKMMFDDLAKFDPKPSFSDQPGMMMTPPSFGESLPDEKPLDSLKPTPPKKGDEKKGSETKSDEKKPEKGKK
jgi:hypothetical protein